MSLGLMAAASTSTRTSLGPGTGFGMSEIFRSLSEPVLSKRSARIQCSERKAIAAQAEELAIPIPRSLNTSHELVPGMTATILVTGAAMLVL